MISPPGSASRAAALALLLVGFEAAADEAPRGEAPRGEEVIAEALFAEGKRLMTAKRYDDACPKLSESQRIDPSSGTALLLALCHERNGKLASAWSAFAVAQAMAGRDRSAEREATAREHLAALQPRLSYLTVRVAPELARKPGLRVLLDNVALESPAWGLALPADGGEHEVRAELPTLPPLVRRVRLSSEGQREIIDLSSDSFAPPPAPPPTASSPALTPPTRAPLSSSGGPAGPAPRSLTAPVVLAGAGVSALVSAGVFAFSAYRDNRQSNALCPGVQCADPRARASHDRAAWKADAATVALGVGGLLLGASAWVLWSRPGPATTATTLELGPGGARVGRSWSW